MNNIFIYSRGKFLELSDEFLKNKAIIRIHNLKDKTWYQSPVEDSLTLELFFDDLHEHQLTWLDKIFAKNSFYLKLNKEFKPFNKLQARLLYSFINIYQGKKDFIIHCEYGKSRSVAVALYIAKKFDHKIINKKEEEFNNANSWVLTLLNSMDD